MTSRLVIKAVAIGLLALSCGAVGWFAGSNRASKAMLYAGSAPTPVEISQSPLERDTRLTTSYGAVVKQTAPSVVNVFSSRNIKSPVPELRPFFWHFFGDQAPRRRKEQSLGSGVIVSKDGYILTNYHVVEGADEVKVSFAEDTKQFDAKVVGKDRLTDLAVLKIAGEFPFVSFADSDRIEVGDITLAIGNPFGVGQTVTMGIISAIKRGGLGMEGYEDFIQTDAAINPGNSGGALIDAAGRLIGINTAILTRTGGSQGIGFAVPSNLARNVMEQLIRKGKVVRGHLGVMVQDVTPELAARFKVPETGGAVVTEVLREGAAAQAGVKKGDVIISYADKPIPNSRSLMLEVVNTPPGSKRELAVLRNGQERSFTVKVKEMPPLRADAEPGPAPEHRSVW